jgi:3-hydroxyisobutyrate dehydrogenase
MAGMSRVAVAGIGRMGLPICGRLLGAGHAVSALDPDPARLDRARALGARTGMSAVEAVAQAEFLLTVLPGSPELAAWADELIGDLPPGLVWADLTSAAPELGEDLASRAAARGVRMIGAPMGGGVPAAQEGTLTLFAGGEAGALELARPVLAALARPEGVLHLGPVAAGYTAKLLVNLLWFGQALAVGEALLLGQSAGLEVGRLREVLLDGPASSGFVESYLPALFTGDYLTSFGLERVVEELESLRVLAARNDSPFELSGLVADLHARALGRFGPVDGELMGVAYLEALAGRRIRPNGDYSL